MYGIIYLITNKITNKEYVGQTTSTLKHRFNRHCAESACPYLHRAIKKYGRENFNFKTVDSANSKAELNEKEIFYINLFGTLAPNGYNLTKGGDSIRSDLPGRILTTEEREKISKTLKLFFTNPENRKNSMISQKKRKVVICHQTGLIYPSIKDAARKLGLTKSKILDQLNGKSKHTKGYTFSLYEDGKIINVIPRIKTTEHSVKKKAILCHQNGNVYSSIAEAAKEFDVDRESICRVLRGTRKSFRGMTFSYMEVSNVI